MTVKQQAILIQMGSDTRIPRESIGYVEDLRSPSISSRVMDDRLHQLNRYVPELVDEFRGTI